MNKKRGIRFSSHALFKFRILKSHGLTITKRQVAEAVKNPDKVSRGRKGRLISQKSIDDMHVIRVIHEMLR